MDDAVANEARRWYARLRSPDCAPDEREAFGCWQAADPGHVDAYERVERLMGRVDELRDDWAIRLAARDALHEVPRRSPWKRIVAVAMTACLVLAVGAVIFRGYQVDDVPLEYYATAVGEQRTITLADGTVLVLDTGTQVEVGYSARARRVTLAVGRVQFDVAHDAERPFVVQALGGRVTALGTRFQAGIREDTVLVALLEGSVSVESDAGNHRSQLVPGEQLAYDASGTLWNKTRTRLEAANGWTEGKLVFNDAPLSELVAEVNRYASTKLRIADPALENLHISGTFGAGDQASLLLALEGIWSIKAERQPGGDIILTR